MPKTASKSSGGSVAGVALPNRELFRASSARHQRHRARGRTTRVEGWGGLRCGDGLGGGLGGGFDFGGAVVLRVVEPSARLLVVVPPCWLSTPLVGVDAQSSTVTVYSSPLTSCISKVKVSGLANTLWSKGPYSVVWERSGVGNPDSLLGNICKVGKRSLVVLRTSPCNWKEFPFISKGWVI